MRWGDMDAYGHINNVQVVRILEEARIAAFGPPRGPGLPGIEPPVHFIETSPVLRAAQAERVPPAQWHDDLSTLPEDGPVLAVDSRSELFQFKYVDRRLIGGLVLNVELRARQRLTVTR